MRSTHFALAAFLLAPSLTAQEPPAGLATVEIERSRTCVDVLSRVQALDAELAPLAERAQRLVAIGEGVALEDDRILAALDTTDALEAEVAAWFARDQELAQRYVATLAQPLVEERAEARDSIGAAINAALTTVQTQANEHIDAAGDLAERAGPCDGAIFVRSVVEEACATADGPLCEAARQEPSPESPFRFVDQPEAVWDYQQMRPWSDPGPLRVGPNGQLDGARTIVYSRTGNVVVSVAFSPILRDRAEMTPEEIEAFAGTNEALGLRFDHPDLAFAPGLGIRATLPEPLGGEARYLLHFGSTSSPDVVWTGQAGTGTALEANIRLTPEHVGKLRAGETLTFSAVAEAAADAPVFSIELAAVNQTRASTALLGYMAAQLQTDIERLTAPRGE